MLTNLNSISKVSLLALSIKDLNLDMERSLFISYLIPQVEKELKRRGFFNFRPHFYLGDEWFSPEGMNAISIPFYLAHPRLTKMEKELTGEAEGETKAWFMRTIRHEIGHCIDHTYQLSKTREWQRIFGNPKKKYDPDNYSYDKESKDFVINLKDSYAQAHPDEDFAETFAVWLQYTKKTWEKKYKNWPKALEKLRYVEKTLSSITDENPFIDKRELLCRASRLATPLKTYYNQKKEKLAN